VTPDDVAVASTRLLGHVRHTPCIDLDAGAFGLDQPLVLKLELLQHAGSFKPRGAFNRVLSATSVPAVGLVAASGGNHGIAVAHVAHALGHRAAIFVPEVSPATKVARIEALGAEVNVGGALYADAQRAADERAATTGAFLVHPYDDPMVVAGQGTCGYELDHDRPGLDTVVVAAGGGGFVAGIAAWFAGRVRVVCVEPATSRCVQAAFAAGHPVPVDVAGVASDSLGARQVGAVPFACLEATGGVECVTVADDDIRAAQRALWRELQLIVEPGGAAALAALLAGSYRPRPRERVAVVVCGANCDPATVT
jgi:threonine dehydratase